MESSARRCFVHAGLPKTGTTFIQDTIWRSRAALKDQGIRLLPPRRQDHFWLALSLRGMLDDRVLPDDAHHAWDRLQEAAGRQGPRDGLLSQEALAPATPDEARRLVEVLDGWEVHVVITARDLQRQLPSAWQQRIQARHTYTFDEFMRAAVDDDPMVHDFWINQSLPDVLASWSTAVPAERVHVVTVPPKGAPAGTLLARFCQVIGVDPAVMSPDTSRPNLSLGRPQAELLRRVNVALGDRLPAQQSDYGRVVKPYLVKGILSQQDGQQAAVPEQYADWCQRTSKEWIAQLGASGYDVVGDLDELMPAGGWPPPVEVTEADVATTAADALAAILVDRVRELDEGEQLKASLEEAERRLEELGVAGGSLAVKGSALSRLVSRIKT